MLVGAAGNSAALVVPPLAYGGLPIPPGVGLITATCVPAGKAW